MKYLKPINEFWGDVLKRDLLGETREEDKFHSKEELREYLISEIEKQGEDVVIQNLDVSLLEDFSWLFPKLLYDVKTLDLSGWKTSNVTNMKCMFMCCDNLESLNLSGWDTHRVTDMSHMFYDCDGLKSLDLSGWDTSNVKDMSYMFSHCEKLTSLDLSSWDISNVRYMSYMFFNCLSLESLDLSGWDTSNINVNFMSYVFTKCPAPYYVIGNKIVRK